MGVNIGSGDRNLIEGSKYWFIYYYYSNVLFKTYNKQRKNKNYIYPSHMYILILEYIFIKCLDQQIQYTISII